MHPEMLPGEGRGRVEYPKHGRTKLALGIGTISLALLLATDGLSSEDNICENIRFVGKGQIAVCVNDEDRVIVQRRDTPPIVLPRGVCLESVWSLIPKYLNYSLTDNPYTRNGRTINMDTLEVTSEYTYSNGSWGCKER